MRNAPACQLPFVINRQCRVKGYWENRAEIITQIIIRKEAEALARGDGFILLDELRNLDDDEE